MPRAQRIAAPAAPSYQDVVHTVRAALHDPDPLVRAEAAAALTLWGLPISPKAVVIAARRAMEALPA